VRGKRNSLQKKAQLSNEGIDWKKYQAAACSRALPALANNQQTSLPNLISKKGEKKSLKGRGGGSPGQRGLAVVQYAPIRRSPFGRAPNLWEQEEIFLKWGFSRTRGESLRS